MFMSQYIDQINQAIYSQSNITSMPDYQKMTKEKFLSVVELMGKISVSKERLDQLSDASLAIWDILLHEIEFSQIFTREMNKSGIQMNEDEGNEKSEVNREIQEILNLKSYQDNPEKYVRSHLDQIIPLILYAWSIANKPQFPKDTQIVALLLVIHSHDKGLLEQVRTGEGKTLIVGLIAAFLALCGHAVDIVSSNRDLAIEGEQKCRSFFQLLKLESGHICSENDEVNHQSYRSDLNTSQGNIVYGEVGTFQRDILEEEFNSKKIFGKRYENRNKSLIVDEVDNMCLDKARHVLYLSHEIESLKWLETLFINIWAAVLRTEMSNSDDISEHIKDISQGYLDRI
ncbi:unnamed protein product [Rotaria magnacalcarata]|uniref:Uncharacterized protein n=1 Tax=Rotaria magnacalcarata TaxID=392030 RepID=A0A816AVB5_9BILA|nr:unnamed protein product [Rotaria magnacalcarata]CAF4650882.1 unnamed protein product [Rotaria magnacalcarata]